MNTSLYVDIDAITANFNRRLNESLDRMEGFSRKIENVGSVLSVAISVPLGIISKKALEAYGDIDSLARGEALLEQNTESLTKRLKELDAIPNLGFKDAIKASTGLRTVFEQMYGIEGAANVSKTAIDNVNNALKTSGGSAEEFKRAMYGFKQLAGTDFPLGEDLNILKESIPQVVPLLNEAFGTSRSEQLQKLKISSKEVIDTIVEGLGRLPRATVGIKQLYEDFTESLEMRFAKLGSVIVKNVDFQGIFSKITSTIDSVFEAFDRLDPETQKSIVNFGALAIAIPPLLAGMGVLVSTILPAVATGFAALLSPVGLLIIAVGGLAAVWIEHEATAKRIADATKSLSDIEADARKEIHAQAEVVAKLTDVLRSNTSTIEDKRKAISELQKISPEYFKGLKAEAIDYAKLNDGISNYITGLEKAAQARLLKADIDKKVEAAAKIRNSPGDATSWLDTFRMALGYKLTGSDPMDLLAYGDLVKLNAQVAVSKIEDGIKPLQEKLNKLAKEGFKPETGTSFLDMTNYSFGGTGRTASEKKAIEDEKAAKAFTKIHEKLLQDTSRAQVEAMTNDFQQKKASLQLQFNEDVNYYQKEIEAAEVNSEQKRILLEDYLKWYTQRLAKFNKELSEIRLFSGFENIKPLKIKNDVKDSDRVAAIMGVSPDAAEKYGISLKQRFDNGIKAIKYQGDKTSLENFLGLEGGIINNSNFSEYAAQAETMINANARIKESFKSMSADALTSLSVIVGEMITGTATIRDLANTLLSSLSKMLAQIAQQNILLGIFTANPVLIAKGLLAGIGAGITGGLAKKSQEKMQNYNAQGYPAQPGYTSQGQQGYNYGGGSYLRGGDVYWSGQRYLEIQRF